MTIPLAYSLRNLWLRRTSALATLIGIALVVFVLAASSMLAQGLQETLLRAGSDDKAIVLTVDGYSEGGSRLPQSTLGLVSAAPGVLQTPDGTSLVMGESVAHVYLPLRDDAANQASVQVRGVTEASFRLRPQLRIVAGRFAKPGTQEAIAGRAIVGRYQGLTLGDGFELSKHRKLEIVGVFEADRGAFESEVWADLDTVRGAFGWLGYLSSVTARLRSPQDFDAFAAALESDKRLGLSVQREVAYYEKVSNNLSRTISGLGAIVSFIFSLGAVLGAMITMYGIVDQRRRELGVLRALGFSRWSVLLALLFEVSLLALLGSGLGITLALCTPFLEIAMVNWATGQSITFRFVATTAILATAMLAGFLVGVLGGLLPALRATFTNPLRALRN